MSLSLTARSLLLALALFLAGCIEDSPTPQGRIRLTVVDGAGTPIPGASVLIRYRTSGKNFTDCLANETPPINGIVSYPNPFDPGTGNQVMGFLLDRSAEVTVQAIDYLGVPVAAVFNGPLAAGFRSLEWAGQADDGSPLPNGLYTLVITARITAGLTSNGFKSLINRPFESRPSATNYRTGDAGVVEIPLTDLPLGEVFVAQPSQRGPVSCQVVDGVVEILVEGSEAQTVDLTDVADVLDLTFVIR